ncbi:hypothetical protein [Noviherbaspirillum sp.]|jgi:hypothetical protein|uniref:hypothetical protein n=1 Tax=Noviherbaspirillum sp. TaxID=1926288 RepID=UPI0025FD03E7|nr:hypothetical protein [Noviherbaspirillum sp.]
MRGHIFLAAVVSVLLIQGAPTLAGAQMPSSFERQKMHVVSRMYQATYGASERCRPSKEASVSLDKAIDQIRKTFPELMTLIDNSPYLPQAREQFNAFASSTAARPTNDELVQECSGMTNMLQQLVETPGGQQAANDMIQTLKK